MRNSSADESTEVAPPSGRGSRAGKDRPLPTAAEPDWPDPSPRTVLFLLDASSDLERRLLIDWIERHRPDGLMPGAVEVASIPPSRRRRGGRTAVTRRLTRVLEDRDDPLLAPLRVVWLAEDREGERSARLSDLLKFGDPRDPGRVRQEWILRRHPDRVGIVAGEPAPASALRDRWQAAQTKSPDHRSEFPEFVALQAALSLERAERHLRGDRYKVPRFVHQDILGGPPFRAGIARLAAETGRSVEWMARRSSRYLKEIAASHSPFVIDLLAHAIRWLYRQGYAEEMDYDRQRLEGLYQLGRDHPLVFLPSHKSNLDRLVLQYVLYEDGRPPNHTAGGINLNFFPIGPVIRRSGVFFIRRSFKDNETYKFVLRQYVDYLLRKRFSLEWYIEGGRSRSGKLRPPRFGLLFYVVDSFRRGACEDVVLIPVSIAYDQIQDVSAYAAEQRGGAMERGSFRWTVRSIRSLRRRHGRICVRFGEPLLLADTLTRYAPGVEPEPDERSIELQKLAFEVSVRINRVTPITPISLVTLALLGTKDRALSITQTVAELEDFLDYVKRRELPTTEPLSLDTPELVREALDLLVEHGVVSRFVGSPETVYSIEPDRHLAAAYYRNTIIHFFVNGAVAELALLAAADAAEPVAEFWDEAMRLRDLLKFEFFFAEKDEYREELRAEIAYHAPDWERRLAAGRQEILGMMRDFRPYSAHWVLDPFLEAYRVVGDALERLDPAAEVDDETFLKDCLALGKQYHLQRRIQSAESVSMVLFDTALKLARNRGLLEATAPGLEERRRAFAAQIRGALDRVRAVEALAVGRRAGLLD
ncbi:MAG: glycerol-3-phosphate 1-O-acyltransferase [Acidimicrobiia bacterium]